jgi:hypothetical protein
MPHTACPVTNEAYLTRMRGEHHFLALIAAAISSVDRKMLFY